MQNANQPLSSGQAGGQTDEPWCELIPEDQWSVFHDGTGALDRAQVPFLLAGALALAVYTKHWRNTKDLDVIIRADQKDTAVKAMLEAGFVDYYEQEAYDRSWIFRGFKEGVIFDVIWSLPNHRVSVDKDWFARARPLSMRGRSHQAVAPEVLIHVKLYVLQRSRCDWVDVLNVLAGTAGTLDWDFLVERMGRDLPLLHAILAVFNWMSPARADDIPPKLRARFALPPIEAEDLAAMEERRTRVLDSRPWFAAHQPSDRPLEL